jgi:galactokinase
MSHNASALFQGAFGSAPLVVASAPGRVNLLGEHTDYNGGPVLPVATAARTSVAVGPAEPGVLELISTLDGRGAPRRRAGERAWPWRATSPWGRGSRPRPR